MRPQMVVATCIGLALVLSWSPAEAKRGRRGKKARSHAPAQTQAPEPQDAATAPDAPPADPSPSKGRPAGKAADKPRGEKVFDFTGLELAGSVRMPQLLYFLDRAEEELERASLERRSFVPAMMRSLDEENL